MFHAFLLLRALRVVALLAFMGVLLVPAAWPRLAGAQAAVAAEPNICTAPIQPVTLSEPTVVNDCTEAGVQAALDKGGQITFACGAAPTTIKLTKTLKTNGRDTVIDGKGLITLDGQNQVKILEKPGSFDSQGQPVSNTLTIQNMRFVNGRSPTVQDLAGSSGAAITVLNKRSRLHVFNSVFENNASGNPTREDNAGGAIYANNMYEAIIAGSLFRGNSAGSGGAIGGLATGMLIFNSRFENNQASDSTAGGIVRGYGGAIYLDGTWNDYNPATNDQYTICGSTFSGNTAIRGGGAVHGVLSDNHRTKTTIDRSVFSANEVKGGVSDNKGGAIYFIEDDRAGGSNEDNFEIVRSAFVGNKSLSFGGAVHVDILGRGKISNSTFEGNRTTAPSGQVGFGGALTISTGTFEVSSATFANNQASCQGGAIHAGGANNAVTLRNTIFVSNTLIANTACGDSRWQGFHTNRSLLDGGKNIQFPRKKPLYDNEVNNLIVADANAIIFQDPLLEPVADNGGRTQTMALKSGSPAINAGAAGCPGSDQRGAARVGSCDIGAFEFGGTPPAVGAPSLRSLSPALVAAGAGSDLTLTVNGSGFTAQSVIRWKGAARPTSFVSSSVLTTTIPKAELAAPGTAAVTVFEPSVEPDGAESTPLTFQIAEQIYLVAVPLTLK